MGFLFCKGERDERHKNCGVPPVNDETRGRAVISREKNSVTLLWGKDESVRSRHIDRLKQTSV
jgi:hypothetical protein